MCSIAAAGLALSIASTAASMYGQAEQASAQRKYQSAQSEEYARAAGINQRLANHEFIESSAAERIKQMQNKSAASEEIQRVQRERMEKQGKALASSESAGTALDLLMGDFFRSQGQKVSVIEQQLGMSDVSSEVTISGYQDRRNARYDSQGNYVTSSVNGPNYLAGALQIGKGGLDYYNETQKGKP